MRPRPGQDADRQNWTFVAAITFGSVILLSLTGSWSGLIPSWYSLTGGIVRSCLIAVLMVSARWLVSAIQR